jgi:putative Ca2+/H+ antiporter (TMEM165/GDT1 family)
MSDFWTALFFVFMAEMGDKTQLMTLGFSTRYKALTVFLGVCIATLLINLISVALGEGFGKVVPVFWVNLIAGIAFIGFGIWTLKGEHLDPADQKNIGNHGPLMTVVLSFFLAELGDKTMLTAVAVATRHHNFLAVWFGSTIGLVAANALAILVGKTMADRFSGNTVKISIAIVYVVSGALAIKEAFYPSAGGM